MTGIQPGSPWQATKWIKQRYQVWPSQGQSWAASKPKAGPLSVTGNQGPGKRPQAWEGRDQRSWCSESYGQGGPVASWPCPAPGQSILGLKPLEDLKVEAQRMSTQGEVNVREKHKWIPGWGRAQHHEGLRWVTVLTTHLSIREKGLFFL